MTIELYLAYLATVAVFFSTPPGPSQALMIANSLRYGVSRSTATLAGDLSANALQMTAAAFGLAVILSTTWWALTLVKWLGVAYLLWIGWRTFTAEPAVAGRTARSGSPGRLWRQGFFTSAANPKAVFFFAALFPQFIDTGSPIWPQLLILGATYLVIDGILLLVWGLLAERFLGFLKQSGRTLNRASGAMMMTAAALLALRDVGDAAPESR